MRRTLWATRIESERDMWRLLEEGELLQLMDQHYVGFDNMWAPINSIVVGTPYRREQGPVRRALNSDNHQQAKASTAAEIDNFMRLRLPQ